MLNDCTKRLFGVETRSLTESRDGRNGSFTGFGPDRISNGGNNAQIHIVNEVNAYTSTQLTNIYNSNVPSSQHVSGFTYGYTGPTPSGNTAYRNFTANNLTNSLEIVKTQVHELGHSLQAIVGTRYAGDQGGQKLEDCVRAGGGFKYK